MAIQLSTPRPIPLARGAGRGSVIFLAFLLLIPLMFFLDSLWLSERLAGNQWLADLLCLAFFLLVYRRATRRLRRLMRYGVPIAMFGESLFSLVLGMYDYRLGSIPIYVFVGHSVVYAVVYLLVREGWFKESRLAQPLMLAGSTALGLYWLVAEHDLFGFLCLVGFLLVYRRAGKSRLFYLTMLCVVAYLELVGTYFGCWSWPEIWFGVVGWMPSGNPPIGIALFYFLFDLGCLWIYKRRNLLAWRRMRTLQALRG